MNTNFVFHKSFWASYALRREAADLAQLSCCDEYIGF